MVGNILCGCLFESVLTIWCSSLLEDARAILSVLNLHLAMCTSFEILCFACMYKSLKIVNFVFLHFLSAWHLSLLAIQSSSHIDSNDGEYLWVMTFLREEGICICICIILEISSLLSKNYPGSRCACVMDNLISWLANGFFKEGQVPAIYYIIW